MAWNVTGDFIETCSCNMLCPCWFGVQELMLMDQGWCASPILVRIRSGTSDGVDLAGCRLVLALFLPGPTMFDGNGTGRLYLDEAASGAQREQLEAIFKGLKGGPMEIPASLVATWLPSETVAIEVKENGDEVTADVGGIGRIVSKPLRNEAGEPMTMQNTGFVMAFQFAGQTGALAPSDGTAWKDPDFPEQWEGRSGVVGRIAWSVS